MARIHPREGRVSSLAASKLNRLRVNCFNRSNLKSSLNCCCPVIKGLIKSSGPFNRTTRLHCQDEGGAVPHPHIAGRRSPSNPSKSGHKKVSYQSHSERKRKSVTKALNLSYFFAVSAQCGAN